MKKSVTFGDVNRLGGDLPELAKASLGVRTSNNIIPEFVKQNHLLLLLLVLLLLQFLLASLSQGN